MTQHQDQPDSRGPIPEAELVANRLRVKRRLASFLIAVLAEEGCSPEDVDARTGKPRGHFQRFIVRLIAGRESGMNLTCDIAYALGVELSFTGQRIARAKATTPTDLGSDKTGEGR